MNMEQVSSYITLGVLGVIAVLFIFGFLRGLRKGFYKSLIDMGFVVLCLIVSIMVAKGITNSIADIEGMRDMLITLKEKLPDMAETVNGLLEYIDEVAENPEMINIILALPAALITPIIFIPIYILLGIIIKIPKLIIERVIVGKNGGPNYRGGSRLLGGVVGGVRNALFIIILLIPIMGYIGLVGDLVATIDSVSLDGGAATVSTEAEKNTSDGKVFLATSTEESGSNDMLADIKPIFENPVVKGINACGGKLVFNSLTTKRVEGVRIKAAKEVNNFAELYANFAPFMNESPENYGDEQKQGIENIKTMLNDSEFLTSVVSGALSYVSEKWLNGEDVFGIEKIDVGEEYASVFDGILETLSTTDSENIKDDINTISGLVNTCIDEGVFKELAKEEPDIIKLLSNKEFVAEIFVQIYKNDRTRPIIGYATNIVVDLISESLANEGDNTPKPEDIDINTITEQEIRSDAEKIADVVSKFDKFISSTENLDSSDPNAFILEADLASLGAALDLLRNTVLLGDTCEYVLKVMLKSDMVSEIGFLNDDFIANLSDKNFKLENALASAQKLAVMALSLTDDGITEDKFEDAIKYMVSEMTPETAESIKSSITEETLKDFGISDEQAETVTSTIDSIVDGMVAASDTMTDEEIEKETEAVNTLIDTMMGATSTENSEVSNVFGDAESSKTGVSAEKFVETVVTSQVVSSAIVGATKDENGETVENPYNVADSLTEDDKVAVEDTIKSYYEENKTGEGSDEELKEKLGAIANVMGMDSSAWFN